MQILIERPPMRFDVEVYVFDHRPDGQTVVYNLDGTQREIIGTEGGGQKPEPSFRCDEEVLRALVAAGSDVLPPSSAQAKHLEDAIEVRDRLLRLVEHEAVTDAAGVPD